MGTQAYDYNDEVGLSTRLHRLGDRKMLLVRAHEPVDAILEDHKIRFTKALDGYDYLISPDTSFSQVELLEIIFNSQIEPDNLGYAINVKESFTAFMKKVDECLYRRIGMSHNDLEDWDWMSEYECQNTPSDAVEEFALYIEEEYGYDSI